MLSVDCPSGLVGAPNGHDPFWERGNEQLHRLRQGLRLHGALRRDKCLGNPAGGWLDNRILRRPDEFLDRV